MLWEKRTSSKQKNGYLYIRESLYIRDGRTKKRKKSKRGEGNSYENRWRYTKKKDIYCGKIIELELKKIILFKEYIENEKKEDFLKYKINVEFEDLLNDFISYLLFIYQIDKKDFFNGKKVAYKIGTGYLSREGINFLKRFNLKSKNLSTKELERFANRSFDVGIFDNEIITLMYVKLLSREINISFKEEEIENFIEIEKKKFKSLKDFIKMDD